MMTQLDLRFEMLAICELRSLHRGLRRGIQKVKKICFELKTSNEKFLECFSNASSSLPFVCDQFFKSFEFKFEVVSLSTKSLMRRLELAWPHQVLILRLVYHEK